MRSTHILFQKMGGVCDQPRFLAQIEETVLANGVSRAEITINGKPLQEYVSGQE